MKVQKSAIPIARWSTRRGNCVVTAFLERPAFDDTATRLARRVLTDIKNHRAGAIAKYVDRFDGVRLQPSEFRVGCAELEGASVLVDPEFRAATAEAIKRITAFARAGMKKNWQMASPHGGALGEQFVPLDRVGVYVPGGAAPLVSTVLMTVTLARVAGVKEIIACTPCGQTSAAVSSPKNVNPFLLYALRHAGATEIYKVGGVQAIGLMAYGTRTIRRVQKIVGPGGTFVTAAKREVYGQVALDLVAGPSEIAVLADHHADPVYVAADLLSQAEHGSGWEKAMLVTTSQDLARSVRSEVCRQVVSLNRANSIMKVLRNGMLIVVVDTLDEGMLVCNRFAPEHLEIMVRAPGKWLKKVRCAGAVFLGKWSPECAGDYVAGPSHVLPTGGAAAMFSGLTVDDFRRRTSFVDFAKADLREVLPVIDAFSRVEGLDAHGVSAHVRFKK